MSTPTALSVRLVGPKADAVRLLKVHIERGRTLRQTTPANRGHIEEMRVKKDEWVSDTVELLKRIFDASAVADSFADTAGRFANYPLEMPTAGDFFNEEMDLRLSRLGVVLKRVEATPDPVAAPAAAPTPANDVVTPPKFGAPSPVPSTNNRTILVVSHGVDHKFTEAVSEFLGRLGLNASLQTREPGKPVELEGATLAGFAVMLMPSDDAHNARPGTNQPLRSDVAFDMGFLSGRVGTSRLAVLFPPSGEGFNCDRSIPYIPLDVSGGWMLHLGRHMKKASVEIDLNRVL